MKLSELNIGLVDGHFVIKTIGFSTFSKTHILYCFHFLVLILASPARFLVPLGPSWRHLGTLLEASWIAWVRPPWQTRLLHGKPGPLDALK